MYFLYIDESGDLGQVPASPLPGGNDQPVLVIGAIIIPAVNLANFTQDFLYLKAQFFPGLNYPSPNHLDKILGEIKGSELRRHAIRGKKKVKRHAIGFLDKLFDLLDKHQIRLISRIWVKAPGAAFNGKSVYTASLQWMYDSFERYLAAQNGLGFVIADSRDYSKNVNVAHSIFTRKYSAAAPSFERVLELPTFGHSENHAGIQVCDILCSAILFPIAAHVYCSSYISNVHVQTDASQLIARYGQRIKSLQFREMDPLGRWKGGITVSDPVGQKSAAVMFK